jgi:hypothetical protein
MATIQAAMILLVSIRMDGTRMYLAAMDTTWRVLIVKETLAHPLIL